ncbi:apolipoprotein C-I [Esox lucius]|nr:apolipoprotein C-I [Esox lucius]
MKLSIAIAVLMLVFAAHTDAQEAEKSIEDHFTEFGAKLKEFTDGISVKTKDVVDKVGDSEFVTKTRTWFTEQFDKLKTKMDETFQKQ